MATIQNFEDLKCWQKARELHRLVFVLTSKSEFKRDFEHKDQINASAGGVMDLIAEGFGRYGNKEFIHFLTMSSGSVCETKSQLHRAFDKNYISEIEFKETFALANDTHNLILGLVHKLKASDHKGLKFK